MTEFNQKGIENRQKRAVKVWLKMWQFYTDPISPLTVEEIAKKIRKKNGSSYSRAYVYEAFKKLKALKLI